MRSFIYKIIYKHIQNEALCILHYDYGDSGGWDGSGGGSVDDDVDSGGGWWWQL